MFAKFCEYKESTFSKVLSIWSAVFTCCSEKFLFLAYSTTSFLETVAWTPIESVLEFASRSSEEVSTVALLEMFPDIIIFSIPFLVKYSPFTLVITILPFKLAVSVVNVPFISVIVSAFSVVIKLSIVEFPEFITVPFEITSGTNAFSNSSLAPLLSTVLLPDTFLIFK